MTVRCQQADAVPHLANTVAFKMTRHGCQDARRDPDHESDCRGQVRRPCKLRDAQRQAYEREGEQPRFCRVDHHARGGSPGLQPGHAYARRNPRSDHTQAERHDHQERLPGELAHAPSMPLRAEEDESDRPGRHFLGNAAGGREHHEDGRKGEGKPAVDQGHGGRGEQRFGDLLVSHQCRQHVAKPGRFPERPGHRAGRRVGRDGQHLRHLVFDLVERADEAVRGQHGPRKVEDQHDDGPAAAKAIGKFMPCHDDHMSPEAMFHGGPNRRRRGRRSNLPSTSISGVATEGSIISVRLNSLPAFRRQSSGILRFISS